MYQLTRTVLLNSTRSTVGIALAIGGLNFSVAEAACPQGFQTTVQGTASTWAAGVSFRKDPNPQTASLDNDLVRVKGPHGQNSFPTELDPVVFDKAPNFTLPAMFKNLNAAELTFLHLDAMSTDNPMPNVSTSGNMAITGLWAAVAFSVDSGTIGGPNTIVRTRSQNGNIEHGSDIYGSYLKGSSTIASSLLGETILEIGAPRIRALEGTVSRDMDALDFGLGVLSHRQGTFPNVIWKTNATFYFSVTKDSAADLHLIGADLVAGVETSGATIYKITWDPISKTWSDVSEDVPASDMGLTDSADDIDALSVTSEYGGVYVFSTVTQQPSDPRFLVYKKDWATLVPAVAPQMLRDGLGTPLEVQMGLDHDNNSDPDAVCIIDPEVMPGTYDQFVGTPLDPPIDPSLSDDYGWLGTSSCLSRGPDTGLDTRIHVEVTGLQDASPLWMGFSTNYDPLPVKPKGDWVFGSIGNAPAGQTYFEYLLDLDPLVFPTLVGTNLSTYFVGVNEIGQLSTSWVCTVHTSY